MITIQYIKNLFFDELSGSYPKEELISFFAMISKDQLGMGRVDIALDPHKILERETLAFFEHAITELKDNKPIQYILGKTQFFGLTLHVNNHVLIPRPETEELVDWVLSDRKTLGKQNLLDIGTGSGCIPIAISKNAPMIACSAIDNSKEAMQLASKNAEKNDVVIKFYEGDILKTNDFDQNYDIIISNPPYVLSSEKQLMQDNVLRYEPHEALFVPDSDPLIYYRKIAELASHFLTDNGCLYFEINQKYGQAVLDLLAEFNFSKCILKQDLFGVDRMIKAES